MNTPLMEYKKHKCQQYNINASLIGEEKYIITGSEENKIFIYNLLNGNIQAAIPTPTKINHIVKSFPMPYNPFSFLCTGLSANIVTLYGPNSQKQEQEQNNEEITRDNNKQQQYLQILEEVMAEYGDAILKIFHKNNFTYSQEMTLESLVNLVVDDEEEEEILDQFEEKLFRKITEIIENEGSCERNRENQVKQQSEKPMQVVINHKKSCKVCHYYKRLLAQKKV